MAKMNLTICDICGDRSKDALPYTIKSKDGSVSVDLCEDDAKPILDLQAKIEDRPVVRRPGRVPVATMEDIEKLKGS
ncbi:hypothetical protein [Salinispora pacifica]|uniref:hypothetical protein n=1 Tax=Salinispora pacifica TaxID=351187 RepID=UPI000375F2D9|nr:hypothetical protein [Salinispora pacifica]